MLRELITEKEYKMIDYWRKKYCFSNSKALDPSDYMPSRNWLDTWETAKSDYLSNIFNNKLILTKTINFEKDVNMLASEMDYYERNNHNNPYSLFLNKVYNLALDNIKRDSSVISKLTHNLTLAKNKITLPSSVTFEFNNGETFTISNGMKATKALKKISSILGIPEEEYEAFRLQHSRLLNQSKMTGKLCLSIHPLDYMTMSDNDNNWGSCMSWRNGGEFRLGTIEMMNSLSVVVAYLASETDMSEIKWNNKKWRELFIVTPDVIAGIKGYPFQNSMLEKEVIKWIQELTPERDWNEKIFEQDEYRGFHRLSFETDYMYNDFGCTTTGHHPMALTKEYIEVLNHSSLYHYFNYSGEAICAWCGEAGCFDGEGDTLICENCHDNIKYCWWCGEPIIDEEVCYDTDDHSYCLSCFYNHTAKCAITGERYNENCMSKLYLYDENSEFDVYNTPYINIANLFAGAFSEIIAPFINTPPKEHKITSTYGWVTRSYSYVTPEQLTEEGKKLFSSERVGSALIVS